MKTYEEIVGDVIERARQENELMFGRGTVEGEIAYMTMLQQSYVRTIRDVDNFWPAPERTGRKILEVGSFLGTVSFALERLGYSVTALDIPELYESQNAQKIYRQHNVPYCGVNLRSGKLPFGGDEFDALIACEIFEHFNFNPLPVLLEVNRVLKPGGVFYITMPNQAYLMSRIKLLLGKSVRNPVSEYFDQLDRTKNMIAALHWREYTMAETKELVTAMGFEVINSYYFGEDGPIKYPNSRLKQCVYGAAHHVMNSVPTFRRCQVVVARKTVTPNFDFYQTASTS